MKYLIPCLFILIFLSGCSRELPAPTALIDESSISNWEDGVSESVTINASKEVVWNYVSNSNNATEWSVYFHHISPLPGIPDGQMGSLRRCFRAQNEIGPFWDEITLQATPESFREIATFNLTGFNFNFLSNGQYVFVRQLYHSPTPETTVLTFQTTTPHSGNILSRILFLLTKEKTAKIFKENLSNIKAVVEGNPRIYEWYE